MKTLAITILLLVEHCLFAKVDHAVPSGFFLPDSLKETTLSYESIDNLILIPVTIHAVPLNLILDTGCRNLVLFGNRFAKMFPCHPGRKIQFSGLGGGKPVEGKLSLHNAVSIGGIEGRNIAVVVVPSRNVFRDYPKIDGVIGYEVFFKFEITIDPFRKEITFRPASHSGNPSGAARIPVQIKDTRPVMRASITDGDSERMLDLLIDTGSVFGLLLKNDQENALGLASAERLEAKGFCGTVDGRSGYLEELSLGNVSIRNVPAGSIVCPGPPAASLGMAVFKNYIITINYFKGYISLEEPLPVTERYTAASY